MRSGPARIISGVWLVGMIILTADAVFNDSLISAVLAIAYSIAMLTFALWGMRRGGEGDG